MTRNGVARNMVQKIEKKLNVFGRMQNATRQIAETDDVRNNGGIKRKKKAKKKIDIDDGEE